MKLKKIARKTQIKRGQTLTAGRITYEIQKNSPQNRNKMRTKVKRKPVEQHVKSRRAVRANPRELKKIYKIRKCPQNGSTKRKTPGIPKQIKHVKTHSWNKTSKESS